MMTKRDAAKELLALLVKTDKEVAEMGEHNLVVAIDIWGMQYLPKGIEVIEVLYKMHEMGESHCRKEDRALDIIEGML